MAMSYSLTWALTWIQYVIIVFVTRNNTTNIISAVLQPFQGLYNLIVYNMSPKVRNARNRKRENLTWCQAITKAWTSRGAEDRAIVGYRYTTKTSSLRQYFQSRLSRFMDRRSNISSSLTSFTKARVSGVTIQPPCSNVQHNEAMDTEHV